MEALIKLGFFFGLLIVGFFYGSRVETRHYASIRRREKKYRALPTVNFKKVPAGKSVVQSKMVMGSTVVSVDYFKRFMANLKTIFGGRLSTYESLVDRARREAILKMKKKALGADMILNTRIETASISKGSQQNSIGSIEVLAYGTAVKFE